MADASPCTIVQFFSSYTLPKPVAVTTLLLFGYVTLLCGKFLFIKSSQLSVCMCLPFTLVRFTNNAALILPPEVDQCRRKTLRPNVTKLISKIQLII